jgi:hypothetical protein
VTIFPGQFSPSSSPIEQRITHSKLKQVAISLHREYFLMSKRSTNINGLRTEFPARSVTDVQKTVQQNFNGQEKSMSQTGEDRIVLIIPEFKFI